MIEYRIFQNLMPSFHPRSFSYYSKLCMCLLSVVFDDLLVRTNPRIKHYSWQICNFILISVIRSFIQKLSRGIASLNLIQTFLCYFQNSLPFLKAMYKNLGLHHIAPQPYWTLLALESDSLGECKRLTIPPLS